MPAPLLLLSPPGKLRPRPSSSAEFDELVGRREPPQLNAIVPELRAQHGLVGERVVDEIPGVGVLLVQVADAGEEASGLERHAVAQRGGLDEGFLDRDAVVRRQRDVGGAAKPRIDVRREAELRFGEAEAARARSDLGAGRQLKPGDRVAFGILRCARVQPRQDQRDGRIEGARCPGRRRRGRGRRRHGAGHWRRCCGDSAWSGRLPLLRWCGGLGLGRLKPLLERLQPGFVGGTDRVDLLPQGIDVSGGIGLRMQWQDEGKREARRYERSDQISLQV